jgi:hypothetical protein
LVVSTVPFVPIVQLLLQIVTVIIMIIGANLAIAAVSYNKRRYNFSN